MDDYHIYEDYKDTKDVLGFALSCEKILRLYFGTDIHELDLKIYLYMSCMSILTTMKIR